MELSEINNLAVLKKMAKKVDANEFFEFAEKVQKVCDEMKKQLDDEDKKYQQDLIEIKAIHERIKEKGFDIELSQLSEVLLKKPAEKSTPRDKKITQPPKYKYTDEAGEEKTWSGSGRVPKVIKKSIDEGHKIEEFLIKKEPSFSKPV